MSSETTAKTPFISVCIPSYNRPETLKRGLESVDLQDPCDVEVIIHEDKSPRREEVRRTVEEWQASVLYSVVYRENEENLGYDRNLKALINSARGEWVIFLGDDDEFVPDALRKLIGFIKKHRDLGYVLRSYEVRHSSGKTEYFKYYDKDVFFEPGPASYTDLFRKSVFISGFTIKRDFVLPYFVSDFDGTLLFQIYLAAEVTMNHRSAYFNKPLTRQHDGGIPFFGNAETEKILYEPGRASVRNSVNFLKGYFKITEYMDSKYGIKSTRLIKEDMSKYFYPSLSIQRHRGLRVFFSYVRELNAIGFNVSFYYYVYVFALVLCGKRFCDYIIMVIKNLLGRTPKL